MSESTKEGKNRKKVVLGQLAHDEFKGNELIPRESLEAFRFCIGDIESPWQDIANTINDLSGSMTGISESLNQLSGLSERYKSLFEEGNKSAHQFSTLLGQNTPALDGIGRYLERFRRATSALEAWKPLFTRLTEPGDPSFSEITQRFVTNSKLLAERGWFPDPNMPLNLLSRLATTDGEDQSEVDTVFANYLKGKLAEAEEDLTKLSPVRAHLIQDAFWAHGKGKYSLSIPVFLSQADGLWFDQFEQSVFMVRDRESGYKGNSTSSESVYLQVFEALRIAPLPIWISERERDRTFSDLNRHQVLHGEVVDYNTEEFSLKAISFLWWLCWTFSELKLSKSAGN